MTRAIIAGPDHDNLAAALETEGIDVARVEGMLSAATLSEAGIDEADLFVLTDLDEATSIPVVRERNPDIRIVVYSHDSLPGFVSGQTDIAMDPDLFSVDMVAEELA